MASNSLLKFKLSCYLIASVVSFNLDPRIPVIKAGNKNAYFGFSVAEHRTAEGSDGISWLLVGAPLDQNRQPNTTRSGALWKCPLTPSMDDCEQVITDGKRSVDSDALTAPHATEIKEGQWLGVSVRSQGAGGSAVVCAHRYVYRILESQYGQGLCYTLNNELDLIEAWEPCKGLPVTREHEDYAFCQAGTSSSLLSDNTLILGTPGPYTWRGTIFTYDSTDGIGRDQGLYMAPVEDGLSPVEKYSYMGMSVVGAKFFSENFSYATGAPRSRGTGQVVIFGKRFDWTFQYTLEKQLILNGDQFGSSYGYEVAAADVNGDMLPDLIVGAPYYFARDEGGAVYVYLNKARRLQQTPDVKLTGKPESQFGIAIANAGDLNRDGCEDVALGAPYEGNGVVYIHLGRRKEGLVAKPDQVITAESLPLPPGNLKTFGYALSGGLDLDANGYPDLLVGAYSSDAIALIRTRPIIDIKTSIRPSNIISNIDPSKSGCEKDPSSDYTCFHFETCCRIESQVKSTQTNAHDLSYVIEAETFPGGKKYSRVFFGSSPTAKRSNVLENTINLHKDVLDCREHIVYLKNNTRDIQTPIKFKVTYKIDFKTSPLYSTRGALPDIDDYPVLNATAISTFTANFLNDCGEDDVCISDLVVEPKLLLPKSDRSGDYALTLGQEDEIRLQVKVTNYGESAYEGQLFVKHHAELHYIGVNAGDKHVICTRVNNTIVSCMLDNPFKQKDIAVPILRFDARSLEDTKEEEDPAVVFEVWANSTSKPLNIHRKPVVVKALVIKNAELSIHGRSKPEQVVCGGEVKGESAMKHFEDVGPRVNHTYEIYNKGPWHVSQLQVVIQWPYQLASDRPQGKWLLYLEDVPKVQSEHLEVANGQCHIAVKSAVNPLNLTPKPIDRVLLANYELNPFAESSVSSSKNGEEHNSTSIKYSSSSNYNRVRRKREVDEPEAEALTVKEIIEINCKNNKAKCIEIKCIIYKIERNRAATITVRSRLWNTTLIEDDSNKVHSIKIGSSAAIRIPESFHIHQSTLDDEASVETEAYPDFKITESTKVPVWVIILSIIVGILVLIIIIILLRLTGFFKRSRPDFTLSGNLEKNNHESKPFIEQNANSL